MNREGGPAELARKCGMTEQRKDGVARSEDDWRRLFQRFPRAAEPTPLPASSKVRARR